MANLSQISGLSRRIPLRQLGRYGSVRCVQTASQPNLSYPLYPSVAQLLKQNNIPSEDISKITATGPNGRILKGDVLSYLGSIAASYPADLASQLAKNSRLDLSNIKISTPKAPSPATPAAQEQQQAKEEVKLAQKEVESIFETKVAVPVSFSKILSVRRRIRSSVGVEIPLATFVSRAADIANENLPVKPSQKQRSSALFDEILGQRSSASTHVALSRGDYLPEIASPAEFYAGSEEGQQMAQRQSTGDIIDVLTGRSSPSKRSVSRVEGWEGDKETSIFSLTIPEQEEARAMAFLEKMQVLLEEEPAQLLAL
ncbi:pyruvate dehydrogenase complex protein X [Arthroderma uncinatum]|uniref:pyruvate dehydrogenase complex protein X n=1 Tax=Arthroderma uncinatum TaxID=74035 RepID=UPI00144AAF60|nr:pyruvate dehydrogenase complex protein X [Arthroderma uncinatum]KAF3481594.1 pyruvate dehydrogenase complex protein X [Arthroderma uncinatum]